MQREPSERAPKQGFGGSENDKATGSTAVRQPRIERSRRFASDNGHEGDRPAPPITPTSEISLDVSRNRVAPALDLRMR